MIVICTKLQTANSLTFPKYICGKGTGFGDYAYLFSLGAKPQDFKIVTEKKIGTHKTKNSR